MMAARLLRAKRIKLTRQRLKSPFYAQCYACGPFALLMGIGTAVGHAKIPGAHVIGLITALVAVVAYLATQARWFSQHLQQGLLGGVANAARAFAEATLVFFALALLFVDR